MYLCMDCMHSHYTFHLIICPLMKGIIIHMLDVYCSPIKFPRASMIILYTFFIPQNNCLYILTWWIALLFFHLYSCTFYWLISEFPSISASSFKISLHQLVICFIVYCAKSQPFLPPIFLPFFLIVIFLLALSEIGFIAGNIYWASNCRNTVITLEVTGSAQKDNHDSVADLTGHFAIREQS